MDGTHFTFLHGGPGTGKSTTASSLFALLKILGVNSEMIPEYAKDRTWMGDSQTLKCQHYVTGKQIHRCVRVAGQVDIAVSDTSPMTGLLYRGVLDSEDWANGVVQAQKELGGTHIFLVRNPEAHPYNPMGRWQNEEEAMEKDSEMRVLLDQYEIPYHVVQVQKPIVNFETTTIYHPTLFEIYNIVKSNMGL